MNELTGVFDDRRRCLREEDQTSVSLLGTIRILLDEVERLRTHVDELQEVVSEMHTRLNRSGY
jgi:hypothetical protein